MLVAVKNNYPDVVNLLISAGADVNASDRVSSVLCSYFST